MSLEQLQTCIADQLWDLRSVQYAVNSGFTVTLDHEQLTITKNGNTRQFSRANKVDFAEFMNLWRECKSQISSTNGRTLDWIRGEFVIAQSGSTLYTNQYLQKLNDHYRYHQQFLAYRDRVAKSGLGWKFELTTNGPEFPHRPEISSWHG